MEENSWLLLLYMVFQVILLVIGIEIKQNFKSFSPKVPEMQPKKLHEDHPKLQK